mmetsp:Transcript_37123/g.89541  ORF Transcript_37123/g.89541 Transcript_37123/m.89541 type:complete len:228 (+) Transcript_37123:866-1549(+)
MEGRPPRQVPKVPRAGGDLPHQTVLHVQHAHHPPDGARVQPVLRLTAALQPRAHQHTRAHPRQVAGQRGRTVHPRGRHSLLHLPPHLVRGDHLRSVPRGVLPGVHPHCVRALFQDVDRGIGGEREGRGEAAEGQSDGHEGTSRFGAHSRSEPLYSHRGRFRRHVHRSPDGHRGFYGCDWYRYGYSVECYHHLSVLRGLPEGAAGGNGGIRFLRCVCISDFSSWVYMG